MRRWNGWGDDATGYVLSEQATAFLENVVDQGMPPEDARLTDVLRTVPSSRLPDHSQVSKDPLTRLRHARGQSLPDWVALRSGQIPAFPDGVAFPASVEEVQALVRYAEDADACIIAYGGGTSVVGHINPEVGGQPCLTVDMRRLCQLVRSDRESQLFTFGAGIAGPDLEAQLRAKGYTLGHFPQSFELSTLGGWIATRSTGQQSLGYGRIERLFAGGRVICPAGVLELSSHPASAAGPDLRQVVLGSEGRLGILVEATMRATPLPETEGFHGMFLPDWDSGLAAAREVIQARLPLSMLRLSTPAETTITLVLAGHERLIGALERLVALRGAGADKCLLILAFTGNEAVVSSARKEALHILGRHGAGTGAPGVGRAFGSQWAKARFRTPYLRNTLWERGYAVDTLETAVPWSKVAATVEGIETALRSALSEIGERVHVFTHLSHVYPTGSSIYTTFLFRLALDPEETLRRWRQLKQTASEAIVAQGATISHQHGVGTDHAPYLPAEKGELGMAALRALSRELDPDGIMNPGKLF